MINREWQVVQVLTYSNEIDSYGQKRQGIPTQRNVEMVIHTYQQSHTVDIRYTDVELIGLTKDKSITDANEILINNEKYGVLYIIPDGRYQQVLMKKL